MSSFAQRGFVFAAHPGLSTRSKSIYVERRAVNASGI
jgi:hypothetical protein